MRGGRTRTERKEWIFFPFFEDYVSEVGLILSDFIDKCFVIRNNNNVRNIYLFVYLDALNDLTTART